MSRPQARRTAIARLSEPNGVLPERAFLVGTEFRNAVAGSEGEVWSVEESLDELAQLARTAGLTIVGRESQRLNHPNPATFIGPGKVEEIAAALEETGAEVVIFDDELSPRHQRELEEAFGEGVKLLDRTALILDIFAQHASTREGALQVELAQYEYRLPRLTRAWTNLAQQAGGRAGGATGGVGVRGPGETQLETDRRVIERRITKLKAEMEAVRAHRQRYRARRQRSGVPTVAIVGYTNAGKSTLLNALSDADVLVADQLFATLDPTTRRVELPGGGVALLTDTVGFIQKLPTQLVAAFRATLEEVTESDMLLHVVDVTHPQVEGQIAAVRTTLEDIGAGDKPTVTALNKIDRLTSLEMLPTLLADLPNAVAVSALRASGLDRLLQQIEATFESEMVPLDIIIPYETGELVNLFHEAGTIALEEHTQDGTHIRGRVPRTVVGRFQDVM